MTFTNYVASFSPPPLAKHMLESLVGASESEIRRGGGKRDWIRAEHNEQNQVDQKAKELRGQAQQCSKQSTTMLMERSRRKTQKLEGDSGN